MDNNLPESFGRFRAEMDMAQAPKNNLAPLHLHIPEPKFRPGDVADFGDIIVPEVDANPRPDEHVMPADIHPLAYGLVRVLGYDHHASGSWNPGLDADTMRVMLRKMLLLRAFDDRMFRAQRQGKTSFYMKSFGEEATSVATTMALHSDDMCFPSYRQQGMLITRHDVASPLTFSKTNRAPWGGVGFEITFHVLAYAG